MVRRSGRGLAKSDGIDLFVELIGGAGGPAYAAVKAALALVGRWSPPTRRCWPNTASSSPSGPRNLAPCSASRPRSPADPVIRTISEALSGNRSSRVYGILNGTCNYILTRMETEGLTFEACLKEAQRLGYAEADPTFDIEGIDAAQKLAILTTLPGTEIAPDDIGRRHLPHHAIHDIKVAADLGYRIKLLGIAQLHRKRHRAAGASDVVPTRRCIAQVDGVTNAVALDNRSSHELLLAGPGAGGNATASAISVISQHRQEPPRAPSTYRPSAVRSRHF